MRKEKIITILFVSILLISSCTNKDSSNSNDSSTNLDNSSSEIISDIISSETISNSNNSSTSIDNSDSYITSNITSSENKIPYYTNISDTELGLNLKSSLKTLITQTHTYETTYSGLSNVFKKSDADPNKSGNIIWFYTGTSVSFSSFGGNVGATNREHVWPKDAGRAFPETSKAGSDAHHLRPTETQINSIRGNKSFGVVAQTSGNIAKQANSTTYASGDYLSYVNSTYFYPGKGFRGQTARILFYVHVRWGVEYNLRFVLGSGSSKTIGDIETLMRWHLEEPVSESELLRNEEIYKIQGNRNPFIDMPSYACKIYAHDSQAYTSKIATVCANYY
jgi:endonuclease I